MNHLKTLVVIILLSTACGMVQAQFKWGLSDYSIAVSDVQYGIPFLKTIPIHPGLEIGTSFLKNEKKISTHSIGVSAGYFYHNLIAHAPYVKADYNYQLRIKQTIGIDMSGGIGYLHAFYPGDGYRFSEESGQFETVVYHQAFFCANAALGVSLVKFEKLQPFVRYEQTLMGALYRPMCLLKVGVKISL